MFFAFFLHLNSLFVCSILSRFFPLFILVCHLSKSNIDSICEVF